MLNLDISPSLLLAIVGLGFLPSLIWLAGVGSWASRRRIRSDSSGSVSVIVAARNEEEHVGRALEALRRCQLPNGKLEFLIVDDHSTDRTAQIIEEWANCDSRFRLISAPAEPKEMGFKKRALSSAIRESTGEILLFTDADCAVPEQWVACLAREFANHKVGAIYGASLPTRKQDTWPQYIHWLERLMVNVTMASAAGFDSPASACGHSIGYRKSAFEQIGGFAHSELLPYGDDDLTMQAVAKSGWKVRFINDPNSVVTDLRNPQANEKRHAAARHQSTVKFYPLHWRIQYLLSIVSIVIFLVLPVAAFFSRDFLQAALYFCSGKIALDATMAMTVTRQLGINFPLRSALFGAMLLPFLAATRVTALFSTSFEWKSKSYKKSGRVVA